MNQFNPSSAVKYAICAILALAVTSMCMNVIVESGMARLLHAGYAVDVQHAAEPAPHWIAQR